MEQVQLAQEGEAQQHQRLGGSRQRWHVQHSVTAYNYGFCYNFCLCFLYNFGLCFCYNCGFRRSQNFVLHLGYNCFCTMVRLEEDVEV